MITFYNKVLNVDGKWIKKVDTLNPLNLPANTIRCRFVDGYTPTCGDTQTLVRDNIWDIYKAGSDWSDLFFGDLNLIALLGANTTGVTDMSYMFFSCSSLTSVPLFDTSNVLSMSRTFYGCIALTSIPLFDTSNVTNMYMTFAYCSFVKSGALALYQQASTQSNPPADHTECFKNCGSYTTTGAAELAQIPSDWK